MHLFVPGRKVYGSRQVGNASVIIVSSTLVLWFKSSAVFSHFSKASDLQGKQTKEKIRTKKQTGIEGEEGNRIVTVVEHICENDRQQHDTMPETCVAMS